MIGLVGIALLLPSVAPVAWPGLGPATAVNLGACARVSGGALGGSVATAFCVGQKDGFAFLLTASHVVPKGEARVYDFFSDPTQKKPARSLINGEVVIRLPAADVALVKVPTGGVPLPELRLAAPVQRPKFFPAQALAVGYPRGAKIVCGIEVISGKKLVRRQDGGAAFYWQVETPPAGGASGGPLVSAEGRVIGICTASQSGKGYFAHLDEILVGLKREGYDWLFQNVPQ